MTNGKANMMIQVKEPSGDNAASFSMEPDTSITTTKAEEIVVDTVQGTPLVPERRTQENQLDIPNSSTNEPQMSNWKGKSSYPLDNIITPLYFGVKTRNKLDEHENTARNKDRLVVQGYNKEEGIDYDDMFAPITHMENIRILIAFAYHMGFILFKMDVKSEFLNGLLKKEFYVILWTGKALREWLTF
uniref:Uncharacterized protein LOC104218406 n=1 Tax=Nicotiana sylvestris TaxID=4096 RepID=A0A1U7VYW1_NICSY|nr:PREDICTED: uncharacterized protein LOC104218406 [Nicotiana sylvestris]